MCVCVVGHNSFPYMGGVCVCGVCVGPTPSHTWMESCVLCVLVGHNSSHVHGWSRVCVCVVGHNSFTYMDGVVCVCVW